MSDFVAKKWRTRTINDQLYYIWTDETGNARATLTPPPGVETAIPTLGDAASDAGNSSDSGSSSSGDSGSSNDQSEPQPGDEYTGYDEWEKEHEKEMADDDTYDWDTGSNSTTASGPNTLGAEPTPANTSSTPKGLDTEFEQVGIAAGRDLAAAPASGWQKSPSKLTANKKTLRGDTFADSLNNAAQQILQGKTGTNKGSRQDDGFVARAIPKYSDKSYLQQAVAMAYETSGFGGPETQIAQTFSRLDRFERGAMMHNTVFSGFTFFSRPRLCLRDWNICANRKLSALKTTDKLSIPFAIRCYLDTQFAADSEASSQCPLFDKNNPFLVPLTNCLKSVSGFNDPTLQTETTEGGYFSEDQTYVVGGDRMSRTYDVNCSFRDLPGSPILAMFDYWTEYMAGLTDGSLQQYADAIDLNRIDYTVSIYRLMTDRTRRFIVRWSKCTGCYPVSAPTGVAFNKNEGDQMVSAAAEISVPFKVNRIEYDDPVILKEFNMLVRRYAGEDIFGGSSVKAFDQLAQNNYSGIPYIRPSNNGYELLWLQRPDKAGEFIIGSGGSGVSDVLSSSQLNVSDRDTTGQSGNAVI